MQRYPKEVKDFIAKNVAGATTKDLVELVNAKFGTDFTESKMKSYKANNNLKSGTKGGLPAGHASKTFPIEIKKFITDNHIGVGSKGMAELLNKTFNTNYTAEQMKSYYGNHNINSGLDGRFEKGIKPWNTGLKGVTTGGVQTQFKKGHLPHNYVPVGSERIRTLRTNRKAKDDYIDVKIADPNKWKAKHILMWEAHNGPVPKGHAVIFGDGNNRNFDPDNLVLVSRKQLAVLNKNRLIQNDANLTRTAVITADLILKIGERKTRVQRRGGLIYGL